jgi:hypothetical protein
MSMEKETKTKKYEFIDSVDFEEFECNSGWHTLISTALDTIESHLISGYIVLDQVKEKFGTLRIYYTDYSNDPDYVSGVFDFAEMMSHHICEKCGKPGSTRHNLSWVQTLCENHYIGVMAKKLDYTKLLDSEK